MIKRSLWLTASLPILAAARNCTVQPISDDEAVGWQPGGCYRGTWNIVSTCLSTIIACTWSIQHLNIPATDDSGWEKNKRKMKWMIITVFFPELVLIHAMFEFHMAWKALRLVSKKQPVEWPWWFRNPPLLWLPYCRRYLKAKHLDAEDPGSQDGNKLESKDSSNLESKNDKSLETQDGTFKSKEPKWTLAHCYFANMGGFICTTSGKRFLVTAQQLADSSSYACPEITMEEIQDKSKQDWLAKLFAALQILQLILSIITRHIQGVQFSQLETVTLSFAICGVLVYCIYFHKPQKIELAIRIEKEIPVSNKSYDSFWAIMLNKETGGEKAEGKKSDSPKPNKAPRIPNDNIPVYNGNNEVHPAVYLLALASGLFGAIHAIAWNFEFPTEVEKLLWKVATCISAASPVVGLLAIPFAQFTKASGDPELFAVNCLRLMQEYSWHVPSDMLQISNAIKELEDAIAKGKSKKYSEIFSTGETGEDNKLVLGLQKFLSLEGDFEGLRTERPLELHDNEPFIQHFHRLVNCVIGKSTKKIDDAARIDAWPRQSLLPRGVNQSILYLTGFLYCASRLIILGVSFSSLRKMPGSVYIATNWTEYMPTFGAMGG